MTDGRVRLFVALELPAPVRDTLVRWRSRLDTAADGALRPVAVEALHVTLCFLGWRAEEEIEPIAAACEIVTAESGPALALADAVWLPRRRPSVLAVELDDPEAKLAPVQAALSAALSAGGWYEPETRPYLAHITVARVSHGARFRPSELSPPPHLEFRASRVVLYRSRLSRTGARYEALASVELTG